MAVDMFLKITANGTWVRGDSTHKAYQDWIEVESFDWGVSVAGGDAGSGRTTAQRQYKEFRWVARYQRAMILLWKALAQNETVDAELHLLKPDPKTGGTSSFLKYGFKQGRMTGLDQAVAEEPMEEYALVFNVLEIDDATGISFQDQQSTTS